jgi:hypothetical protein
MGSARAERQARKVMLFLLPLSTLWWWPLGMPFSGFAMPFGGLGLPMLLGAPASLSSVFAYAVVFVGMGLFARHALQA